MSDYDPIDGAESARLLAKVADIGRKPLSDIPAMLRELADLFEEGRYPECKHVLVVRDVPHHSPEVYSYGPESEPNAVVRLLACAQARVVAMFTNGLGQVVRR